VFPRRFLDKKGGKRRGLKGGKALLKKKNLHKLYPSRFGSKSGKRQKKDESYQRKGKRGGKHPVP